MRLAFAISTTRFPNILLFDEMISFGDASFARKARQRVEAMLGQASILALASHDLGSLKTYCNRAVMIQQGAIVSEGSVEDVWKVYLESQRESA